MVFQQREAVKVKNEFGWIGIRQKNGGSIDLVAQW